MEGRFDAADARWRGGGGGKSRQAKVQLDPRFALLFSDPDFTTRYNGEDPLGQFEVTRKKKGKTKHRKEEDNKQEGGEHENDEPLVRDEEEGSKKKERGKKKERRKEKKKGKRKEEKEKGKEEARTKGKDERHEVPHDDEEDVSPTARLAVCKCDWDRVKAVDLLVLLQSFAPSAGVVRKVTVYPSLFGQQREAKEATEGPRSVLASEKESDGFDAERLRQYELEKLDYYYAIVDCDSAATADTLYTSCDGLEIERTGNILHLSFVPDELTFDVTPRDEASEMPVHYNPPTFYTKALQHSKVELTWDSTRDEEERKQLLRPHKVISDELHLDDFKAYLASESESEPEDELNQRREKYKALLQEFVQDEPQQEMEITFTPGLEQKVQERIENNEASGQKKKKTGQQPALPTQQDSRHDSDQTKEQEQANLELLMLGEKLTNDRKAPTEQAPKGKKQKKRKRNARFDGATALDTKDARFRELLTSSDFAIDPTRPQKLTAAMKQIQQERTRLREEQPPTQRPVVATTEFLDPAVQALVSSVKRKSRGGTKVRTAHGKRLGK